MKIYLIYKTLLKEKFSIKQLLFATYLILGDYLKIKPIIQINSIELIKELSRDYIIKDSTLIEILWDSEESINLVETKKYLKPITPTSLILVK